MRKKRVPNTIAAEAALDRMRAADDRGDEREAVREARTAYEAGTPAFRAAVDEEMRRRNR